MSVVRYIGALITSVALVFALAPQLPFATHPWLSVLIMVVVSNGPYMATFRGGS